MLPLQKEQRDPAPSSILDTEVAPDRSSPEAALWLEMVRLAIADATGGGQGGRPALHQSHDRDEARRFLLADSGPWRDHRHWVFGLLGVGDPEAMDEGLRRLLGEEDGHAADDVGADLPAKGKPTAPGTLTDEERRERQRAASRRAMTAKRQRQRERERESAWARELMGGSALAIPAGFRPGGARR